MLSSYFTMVLFGEVGAQWNTNEPVERSRAREERRAVRAAATTSVLRRGRAGGGEMRWVAPRTPPAPRPALSPAARGAPPPTPQQPPRNNKVKNAQQQIF